MLDVPKFILHLSKTYFFELLRKSIQTVIDSTFHSFYKSSLEFCTRKNFPHHHFKKVSLYNFHLKIIPKVMKNFSTAPFSSAPRSLPCSNNFVYVFNKSSHNCFSYSATVSENNSEYQLNFFHKSQVENCKWKCRTPSCLGQINRTWPPLSISLWGRGKFSPHRTWQRKQASLWSHPFFLLPATKVGWIFSNQNLFKTIFSHLNRIKFTDQCPWKNHDTHCSKRVVAQYADEEINLFESFFFHQDCVIHLWRAQKILSWCESFHISHQ